MDTYIAAQKLPVSYTLSGNVTVVSVIGNTVTARIPMDTITAGFVKFQPTAPASSSADSPGYDNVLAVDATGVYTFYGSGGWGKSPRYSTHWDDLTENVRFLKVDAPMSLTSAELANAYDSLELRIATRDTIGLVKGAVSRTDSISITDAFGVTVERLMKYSDILELVNYLPQTEGSTASWQAGVRIAEDGSMSLPYADPGTPGAVLLGGNNPFAAATVGSVYAVAKWVIDYVTGLGSNLAESYVGTGGDSVTAAGAVAADWQGGTLLVDPTGRAYVPDATDERKGIVLLAFAEAASQDLGESTQEVPLVPTVAKAMELDAAMKEDILRTYPNANGNPAGVVNPQGAILLQDASTTDDYSGAIDIRAAGTGMYGGVYVSDDLSAQDEAAVVGPLVDFNNEEYPVVPTTTAVTSYVDSKIEDTLEAYSFGSTVGSVIQQPNSYASTTAQGVIRLGPGLENVSGPAGNIVTQVQDASETAAGKVYVIQSGSSSIQAPNAVPSVQYVEELIANVETEQQAGTVSTPGAVYVSTGTSDDDVPVLAGYNRVPTVDYMKDVVAANTLDSSEVYDEVSSAYANDARYANKLREYVYNDIITVGTEQGWGSNQSGTEVDADTVYRLVSSSYSEDNYFPGLLRELVRHDMVEYIAANGGSSSGSGGGAMTGQEIYAALGAVYSYQASNSGLRKFIIADVTTTIATLQSTVAALESRVSALEAELQALPDLIRTDINTAIASTQVKFNLTQAATTNPVSVSPIYSVTDVGDTYNAFIIKQ